jgi:hypothetical protein
MVTDLLERRLELDSKESYLPSQEESEYLAELQAKYLRSLYYHTATHRYFNDKSLSDYLDRANDDSFLYVAPTPKDNWHSKTRRQTPREKFDALMAAILDQNLSPEVFAMDERGKDQRSGADVMDSLIRYSDFIEDADTKRKLRAHELLKNGTCATEVSWLQTWKNVKKLTKEFDPATGEAKWSNTREKDFEGIWTKIVPLNRVLLGDVTKYFIEEQPYIFKEYVMQYDEAYMLFNEWKNWKYVTPVGEAFDTWNDTLAQTDTEQSTSSDRIFVRMRVYENKWSDEYAIVLNNVLMTPPGFPMPTPDKGYSITWTQNADYDQAFAYGRSFFSMVHNDSVTLDFLYNAMIDKARQGLEPPLITSFKNLINKNMFAPGKVTHGDVNFKRAVDHNGVTSADIEIARFVEENINKSSVSPIAQGQGGGSGMQTAFEIREQQKAALRMIGLVLYSIARMERDVAEKKLHYILKHYPKLKMNQVDKKSKEVVQVGKTFTVRGEAAESAGVGRKEISFAKVPPEGEDASDMLKGMMDDEMKAQAAGERMKSYLVDPDFLRKLKYVFHVVVNPAKRKSKMADVQEAREKYSVYIQNPLIDPEWATRLLLRANEDDEEAAIKKQQPQPQEQPGQEQQGQQGDNFELRGRGGVGTKGAVAPSGEGANQSAMGGGKQAQKRVAPNQQAMAQPSMV